MSAGEERRYAEFRRLLIEEREKAGLSQNDLGAKLVPPRPQSYVGKIESGTRRLDALEFWDIARAVGYDPCDVMNRLEAKTAKRTSRRTAGGNKLKK
ncbi:MAG TPA: helix-turn-helix transcriptional regulator [Pyrinomonadaceae bacterium]|jgi:transcriptional regulator with XRE-family HTH domain|nr:helix-turn-helix transcriptional regulator [Pyrinomonadaceae bacterium]